LVHGTPKLLKSQAPQRISTPWVAGSNPAWIAIHVFVSNVFSHLVIV
jgi:hypothetical protein